jgi:hypothetical protein
VKADSRAKHCSCSKARPFLQIPPSDRLEPLGDLRSNCSLLLPDVAMVQAFGQLATTHFGVINPPHSSAPEAIVDLDWLFWPQGQGILLPRGCCSDPNLHDVYSPRICIWRNNVVPTDDAKLLVQFLVW